MNFRALSACTILALTLPLVAVAPTAAQEIGFAEDFALADDREQALRQLIPGTEQYYYYYCLHYQNTGQLEKIDDLMDAWVKRHGNSSFVQEIKYRQALLTYSKTPEDSLEFIRRELNLNFGHQRQVLDNQPDLVSELNQDLISRERLTQLALQRSSNTDSFENSALDWLGLTQLDPVRRRHLLERLQRPDLENLPDMIVADLVRQGSRGFGSLNIHRMLTREQMDECLRLRRALLTDTNFVYIYLTKLRPNPDADWRSNDEVYVDYLDRVWSFVSLLPPAFNSLKANVLYHRLVHDRSIGIYDQERFMTYVQLPRQATYTNPEYLRDDQNRRYVANLASNFEQQVLLPPVGNDEPLVRSYLQHYFVDAASFQPFARFIRDTYLKALFAETKIVNGIGDQEEWYAMLSPAALQALRDRVDLDFAHTNPDQFRANDAVELELDVKNVENLIVKVFEINTQNFYRQQLREISTDINLDGLVANDERLIEYEEPPLRRMRRKFEFPELKRPGVYVVDFIGNGKSSRVVIRKGKFRHLVRNTIAGQSFAIMDENNEPISDAVLWMGGREYNAGESGEILVPYTNQPGRQPIVITHGGVSTLDYFQHEAESYSFEAGFYVDRESLVQRKEAAVMIRTGLDLAGTPVSVKLLKEMKLVLTSTDLDGISTTREIPDFEIFDDKEAEFTFQVPERLSNIRFQLMGQLERVTQGDKITVAQQQSFSIRQIDRTPIVEDIHFRTLQDSYYLELLGKTGEPIPGRALTLSLKPRDFRFPISVVLKTDEGGRVKLGELDEIASIQASSPGGVNESFVIPQDEYRYYQTIHGVAGGTIHVPYLGEADSAQREELSLYEVRGGTYVENKFDALSVQDGMIVVSDLPAGDYDLLVKSDNRHYQLRLTAGDASAGYALGDYRQLELRADRPFHVTGTQLAEDELVIQTSNVSADARVHVFATSFSPPFSAHDQMIQVADAEPYAVFAPDAKSLYVAGRKIGDEYQYILDRRYARKFPGNFLERPSLLLNPWAVRSTETDRQDAADGNNFAPESDAAPSMSRRGEDSKRVAGEPTDFSNLDFLADTAQIAINLIPDEDGKVSLPLDVLANYAGVRVVAIDAHGVCTRDIYLSDYGQTVRDLRLANGLDPTGHYAQQKQVTLLNEGDKLELEDVSNSRFQSYSTLGDVYGLYLTLSGNSTLAEFSFILKWHEKSPAEKNTLYSKYACHELNFFLMHKDPDFFRDVVQPYLNNKKDKTYLDNWLLEAELQDYIGPWRHARMNVVERILLGHRVSEQLSPTRRHVRELYELTPTTRDSFNVLFQYAVKGNSLDTADDFGLGALKDKQAANYSRELRLGQTFADEALAENMPAPPGGGGAPARGGRGGFRGGGGPGSGGPGQNSRPSAAPEPQSAQGGESDDAEMENGRALGRRSNSDRSRFRQDEMQRLQEFEKSIELRDGVSQLYRKLDKTKEWAENNYYQLPIEQQLANLVDANQFWLAYVDHDPNSPFFSPHFPEAAGNFTEMMFALSVMDIPVEAPEHDSELTDRSMTLTAGGPMLAFHEEIQSIQRDGNNTPILVSQNFFRHGDRYINQGGERFDKFVTEEFLTHIPYGCQVVVTNPTSTRQKIDILTQIPEGALPINSGKYTNSTAIDLEPYHTQSIEFYFYFPDPGSYEHYPVHVSKDENLMAFAEPMLFNVVNELTNIDRTSWAYVSQFGTNDEVIEFLETHNLLQLDLSKIAFRMQDEEYFEKVIDLLEGNFAYDTTLWSYGVKHNHVDSIREFLQSNNSFVSRCGNFIDTELVTINPVDRYAYQHLEYRPLVNARAHQLGPDRKILNDRFYQQYDRLLKVLSCQAELSDEALMAVTYYMLLQDRVEDGIKFFSRVNPDRLPTRIQYDYFAAYLDMFNEKPTVARQTAERYSGYSVDRWRNAFQAILAQLDEIDGASASVIDTEDRDQTQTQLADQMPSFDFKVESKQVEMSYKNLTEANVNYYVMDIELLFSRNPFVQQYSGQFSFIQPNLSQTIELPKDGKTHSFELPEELRSSNVLVEISAVGDTKTQAYYSNSLDVQIQEGYGMLRVTHEDSGRPVSKTYVKAYARMKDGSIKFYKDGYTDLRGRFDYGSLSTNELDFVDRFSILVYSDELGAVVRETAPPQQ